MRSFKELKLNKNITIVYSDLYFVVIIPDNDNYYQLLYSTNKNI